MSGGGLRAQPSAGLGYRLFWRVLPPLSVVAILLLVWEYLVPMGIVPGVRPQYLGTPSGIAQAANELAQTGYGGYGLFDHVKASLFL